MRFLRHFDYDPAEDTDEFLEEYKFWGPIVKDYFGQGYTCNRVKHICGTRNAYRFIYLDKLSKLRIAK